MAWLEKKPDIGLITLQAMEVWVWGLVSTVKGSCLSTHGPCYELLRATFSKPSGTHTAGSPMTGDHPRVLQPELTLPKHLCAPRQSGPSKGHPEGHKADQESPSKCLAVIWVGAIRARSWGRQLTDSVLLRCACNGDSNGFRTDTKEPRVSMSRTATTTSKVIDDSSHTETAAFPASPHYPSSWVGQGANLQLLVAYQFTGKTQI